MTPTLMTIIGFCVIFLATTAGSAMVFFFKNGIDRKSVV